jgi:hypothetical protein
MGPFDSILEASLRVAEKHEQGSKRGAKLLLEQAVWLSEFDREELHRRLQRHFGENRN